MCGNPKNRQTMLELVAYIGLSGWKPPEPRFGGGSRVGVAKI